MENGGLMDSRATSDITTGRAPATFARAESHPSEAIYCTYTFILAAGLLCIVWNLWYRARTRGHL